ncbi:UNVERIFIED_CONTAM: Acetoacetyl-CoA synthetase [Trichonephila clavipes]
MYPQLLGSLEPDKNYAVRNIPSGIFRITVENVVQKMHIVVSENGEHIELSFCSVEALNPKGCRFGPSEIYNIVETLPEVLDCLCVSQYGKDKDERVVLFVKIRDGYSFNEDLASKARKSIERYCSFRHVPEVILEVKDIPYNLTGKRTEVIVKKIINNIPHSIVTVRNPESLQFYYNIPELEGFYE